MQRNARLIFWAIVVAGILALVASTYIQPKNTFILKEDGWHPNELLIQPGETVTFINRSKNAFWPASNPHPQHTGYQGFDAGHPIPSGESWSFTFTTPGKWGLHDHLRSFYTASIDVGDEAVSYDCTQHLAGASVETKKLCWEESLNHELQTHGAKAAFQLFAAYYAADPDFTVVGCHLIAHNIGDAAYGEYLRQGKNMATMQFPPETMYCGYGYYHGILEHLIRDNPNFKTADAFCKELVAANESTIPRIRLNCYHAIGHGFIPEPTDVSEWGNVGSILTPAVAACSQIPDDTAHLECLEGAFNVIADWMWNDQFGFHFPRTDPLALCGTFADSFVSRACYDELSMRLPALGDENIYDIYTKYVASVHDDVIAGMIIDSAVGSVVAPHISENDFVPYVKECRMIPERVQYNCLKGLAGAFTAHGEPEKEYVKAIALCSSSELTGAEKDTCYRTIFNAFRAVYTKDKVQAVCALVEPAYQKYCSYIQ